MDPGERSVVDDDIPKFKLLNTGNTCYLNSCIQCLMGSLEIYETILDSYGPMSNAINCIISAGNEALRHRDDNTLEVYYDSLIELLKLYELYEKIVVDSGSSNFPEERSADFLEQSKEERARFREENIETVQFHIDEMNRLIDEIQEEELGAIISMSGDVSQTDYIDTRVDTLKQELDEQYYNQQDAWYMLVKLIRYLQIENICGCTITCIRSDIPEGCNFRSRGSSDDNTYCLRPMKNSTNLQQLMEYDYREKCGEEPPHKHNTSCDVHDIKHIIFVLFSEASEKDRERILNNWEQHRREIVTTTDGKRHSFILRSQIIHSGRASIMGSGGHYSCYSERNTGKIYLFSDSRISEKLKKIPSSLIGEQGSAVISMYEVYDVN